MSISSIKKALRNVFQGILKNLVSLADDSPLDNHLKPLKIGDKSTPIELSESELKVNGTINAESINVNGSAVATGSGSQLTDEEVQDKVGAMFSGNTETLITATYQDADGTIDLVVDNDLSNYDNSSSGFITATLTTEQVQDIVGAMFSGNTETRITATYQDSDGTIDLEVDNLDTDTNTTYAISCVDGDNSDEEKIRLTAGGSGSGTDDVVLEAGTGLSIARNGDKITFTNTVTDTDTVLTSEQVQDIVGAMFSGNTETRISATYQDGDGTIDLAVDDMTADTNTNQLTEFTVTADSGSNQTIAHGNTLDIEGGQGISTTVEATDKVTVIFNGNMGGTATGFTQFEPTYNSADTDVEFDTNGNKGFLTFGSGSITDLNLNFPAVSGNFTLLIKQDGSGNRTIDNYKAFDQSGSAASGSSTVKFAGGSNPTLTTDANHVDIISFYWDADNEIAYGVASLDFQF